MAYIKVNENLLTYLTAYPNADSLTLTFEGSIDEIEKYAAYFNNQPEIRLLKNDMTTMAMFTCLKRTSVLADEVNGQIVIGVQVDPLEQTIADALNEKIDIQAVKIEEQDNTIKTQAIEIEEQSALISNLETELAQTKVALANAEALLNAIEEGVTNA